MRRGVFLGDADALMADTDRLVHMCRIASGLPPAQQGVSCFGAIFGETLRPREEWRRLKEAGLKRVYLGIETGHDPLRKRLKKPGTTSDAVRLIVALKRAGIHVGLIFLLGAGGSGLERDHVRDSAALCRAAPLDKDDLVYFSPLVGRHGITDRERQDAQAEAMKAKIGEGPRTAIYDIRCFVY
jgi:MoaA/NifB/PqqE/SkfB family radical SAM enzyme